MDEYEDGNKTSSCVDDAFFIFRQVTQRALFTTDVDSLCAVINVIARSLEVDYLSVLSKKLTALIVASEAKEARIGVLVSLRLEAALP
jgi:tRNA uridine 5-carbamoylmethylation protein Kti12